MNDASVSISVIGAGGDPDRLRSKTLALRREIDGALGPEGEATLPIGAAGGGATDSGATAKGDPITLGVVLVALIKSGAVTALINCIRDHVKREHVELEVTTPTGAVKVSATNVEDEGTRAALDDLLRRAASATAPSN